MADHQLQPLRLGGRAQRDLDRHVSAALRRAYWIATGRVGPGPDCSAGFGAFAERLAEQYPDDLLALERALSLDGLVVSAAACAQLRGVAEGGVVH